MEYFRNDLQFFGSISFKKNPLRRFVGAEPEINGIQQSKRNSYETAVRNISTAVKVWKGSIVSDGSLNGCDSFEINTAPANGDTLIAMLEDIGTALSENGATVDSSCGHHVHVDGRDLEYAEVMRLGLVAEIIEDLVFAMIPENRRGGRWCAKLARPFGQKIRKANLGPNYTHYQMAVVDGMHGNETLLYPSSNLSAVERSKKLTRIAKEKIEEYSYDGKPNIRYKWLNLASWLSPRKTVEFRIWDGTKTFEGMRDRCLLSAAIIEYAKITYEVEIVQNLQRVDGKPVTHDEWWSCVTPNDRVKVGARFIRELIEKVNAPSSAYEYVLKALNNYSAYIGVK